MDSVLIDISDGIKLFNNGDYFEAHDFFEDIWVQVHDESRLFYQGLIQVAVGCYHLVCGNYKGSFNQFSKATEKLKKYDDCYHDVDLKKLLTETNNLIQVLLNHEPNRKLVVNFSDLPTITTKFCEN